MPDRIAIVSTSYPAYPGDPAGHFVEAEASELAAAGHEVTVICPGTRSRQPGSVRVIGVADGGSCGWPGVLARLRERPWRAIGLLRWMGAARAELVARGPFDRVVAHWLMPCAVPIALGASGAASIEVVVHGSDARLAARLPRVARERLIRALVRRQVLLRCVSSELARLMTDMAGPLAERMRIRVAPASISVSGTPDRSRARAALGVQDGTRLVVILGRLVATKRVHEALTACSLVPDVAIAVVGDGPELAPLCARFPSARFVGHAARERALEWIAAADVLLSASRLEGAPTAIREARALQVPVVAAAAGDLAEWAEADPELWVVL